MDAGLQILVGIAILVVGGLLLAGIKWVTSYATAAIAREVVDKIGDSLQVRWTKDIEAAVAPIRDEVTYNGGSSLKDIVRSIHQQVEALHTDR